MRSVPSWLWRAALVGVLVTRHAGAEPGCTPGPGESARERAKAEYGAGLAAYQQQRHREALDHLMCANTLVPSAELAYNIAVTYDAMGDAASALRWYREYRRQGGRDADSAPLREKVAELESALQERGLQQVTILSSPAGATLRVDAQAMGLTPFTLELKPGRHSYQLSMPGHASAEAAFELRADRSLDLAVALEPALVGETRSPRRVSPNVEDEPSAECPIGPGSTCPSPAQRGRGESGTNLGHEVRAPDVAPATPATLPARSEEASLVSRVGTWTWLSLGAGTLLLGGALGVELRRRQLDSELGEVPQEQYRDRYDSMASHQTTARVLVGLGAAALTAGGVLLVLDASREPALSEVALAAGADGGLCVAAGGVF